LLFFKLLPDALKSMATGFLLLEPVLILPSLVVEPSIGFLSQGLPCSFLFFLLLLHQPLGIELNLRLLLLKCFSSKFTLSKFFFDELFLGLFLIQCFLMYFGELAL